jgi:hypothetical protein
MGTLASSNDASAKHPAHRLNDKWDRIRKRDAVNLDDGTVIYPECTIEKAHQRTIICVKLHERQGRSLDTEQSSRDNWPRAWRWIGPVSGIRNRVLENERRVAIGVATSQDGHAVPEQPPYLDDAVRFRSLTREAWPWDASQGTSDLCQSAFRVRLGYDEIRDPILRRCGKPVPPSDRLLSEDRSQRSKQVPSKRASFGIE